MLRACRRVLRPGGKLAFLTIQPMPYLSASDRRAAHRVGPPGVAVPTSYKSLLRSAGFDSIGCSDVTAEYRTTLAAWVGALSRREPDVRRVLGDDTYDDRVHRRAKTLDAVDAGKLGRFLYVATNPQRAN